MITQFRSLHDGCVPLDRETRNYQFGLKPHHLLHFYLTVIRPVLEYCLVVWHHSLTKAQSETLEAIQRWALRIIYPPTTGLPYTFALTLPKLPSLRDRCEHINRQFFTSISSFLLHFLLTSYPRNHDVTSRLRAASLYPRPVTRTKRYTSFINYSLLHYQKTDVICDFGCFITLFFISMYCSFSFYYCSIFLLKSSGFYNLLLKH